MLGLSLQIISSNRCQFLGHNGKPGHASQQSHLAVSAGVPIISIAAFLQPFVDAASCIAASLLPLSGLMLESIPVIDMISVQLQPSHIAGIQCLHTQSCRAPQHQACHHATMTPLASAHLHAEKHMSVMQAKAIQKGEEGRAIDA